MTYSCHRCVAKRYCLMILRLSRHMALYPSFSIATLLCSGKRVFTIFCYKETKSVFLQSQCSEKAAIKQEPLEKKNGQQKRIFKVVSRYIIITIKNWTLLGFTDHNRIFTNWLTELNRLVKNEDWKIKITIKI